MQHTDLFEFTEWASFGGLSETNYMEQVTIGVNHLKGLLFIQLPGQSITEFPIPDENTPTQKPLAMYWAEKEGKPRILFGEVTFSRDGGNLKWHQKKWGLNRSENDFDFTISPKDGGGVGVLDIRDFGRVNPYSFEVGLVPVQFTVDENDLIVSTIRKSENDLIENWYGYKSDLTDEA